MEPQDRVSAWVAMELNGILSRSKRKELRLILNGKAEEGTLSREERIIWSACRIHPDNKRARRQFIKNELKLWEKRAASA
jgi:hypothetical protein